MPCWPMKKKKFEVMKNEVREAQREGKFTFTLRENLRDRSEKLYSEIKEKLADHIKALERLRKRLREATSEQEREQIEKEIAELEEEIEKYQDSLEELLDFMRDLERRSISITTHKEKEE